MQILHYCNHKRPINNEKVVIALLAIGSLCYFYDGSVSWGLNEILYPSWCLNRTEVVSVVDLKYAENNILMHFSSTGIKAGDSAGQGSAFPRNIMENNLQLNIYTNLPSA